MTTWIGLLRGINVGGNNILPMAALRAELGDLGLQQVRTYIQSGNVVFCARETSRGSLEARIEQRIQDRHGFTPRLLLLTEEELREAVEKNPFPEAEAEPKTLHFWFLAESPNQPDLAGLASRKAANERYQLGERVFYLHAPDGIGRSKLAEKVEKLVGVPATARNFRTVNKLLALAGS